MTVAPTSPKIPVEAARALVRRFACELVDSLIGRFVGSLIGESSAGTATGPGRADLRAGGGGGPAALSTIGQTDTRVGRDGGGSGMVAAPALVTELRRTPARSSRPVPEPLTSRSTPGTVSSTVHRSSGTSGSADARATAHARRPTGRRRPRARPAARAAARRAATSARRPTRWSRRASTRRRAPAGRRRARRPRQLSCVGPARPLAGPTERSSGSHGASIGAASTSRPRGRRGARPRGPGARGGSAGGPARVQRHPPLPLSVYASPAKLARGAPRRTHLRPSRAHGCAPDRPEGRERSGAPRRACVRYTARHRTDRWGVASATPHRCGAELASGSANPAPRLRSRVRCPPPR